MTRVAELQTSEATGRVLLYMRMGEDVSIVQDILARMGAEGVVCTDNEDLCQSMVQEDVDAVLLTERILADGALPTLIAALQGQPPWSDVPVLFVAGGGLESPLAARAMRELPNVLVLDRPVRTATLTTTLQMALRMRDKQRQVRDLLQERENREQMLRESEERLHLAMESGKVGVWEWEVGTERVEWSQGIYALLGYQPGEVTPTGEAWRRRIHPQDLARYDQALHDSLEECEDFLCEFRVVWADGSVHWIEVRGQYTYIDSANGIILRMRGVLSDITERKRAEEALRELNTTLESRVAERTAQLRQRTRQLQKLTLEMSEAEERQRERLAHVLHDDLQQEIAAAKFHLGIVRSRVKSDPSLQGIIAQVEAMLKDAIAKSRSLSHELSPAVLHGNEFAEIFRRLANEMQAKHGLTVHVHGEAQAPSNPIKPFLYRTAQELLFNTVKHAQIQEARLRVRRCGGYLCLSVSDRGCGFDPERLQETAGFGLLSIRERIELMGGRMKIRSAPGQGSTFFVVVPDGTEPEGRGQMTEDGKTTEEGAPSSVLRRPSSVLRVVLADDHEVVRQGLASLLMEEPAIEIVGEASNGREAVELTERLHPDVVLMDVSMPIMGGEEATRRIKQDLPRTRIVSLSMRDEPEARERMCEAGAESYVLKIAPYKELLAAIRGKEAAL